MASTLTKTRGEDKPKPWMVYKHKDGSRNKIYEPAWAGELTPDELELLQDTLANDPDLAYWWGWRPGMKRRAAAAIERVAAAGDPENRAHNVGLVRAATRRPKLDNESPHSCVKKVPAPVTPHTGSAQGRIVGV
jgi:hypothetical protein